MKISEFETNFLNEGPMWSAVKGAFNRQGAHNTLVQDIFIKDFMNDAFTSLKNGISGGWINTSLRGNQLSNEHPPVSTSNISTQSRSPSAVTPASSKTTSSQTTRRASSNSAQSTMAAAKQFNREITNAQVAKADIRASNEKLKKAAEIASAKPAFQRDATDRITIQKAKQAGLIAENYDNLNFIFESILGEMDTEDQVSISSFMYDWFSHYMQGVNWSKAKPYVTRMIQKFETDYPKNQTSNLRALASTALALSKIGAPAGAPSQFKQSRPSTNSAQKIEAEMQQLRKTNPTEYAKLMNNLPSAK